MQIADKRKKIVLDEKDPKRPKKLWNIWGNGELLELRLLETGFLSHFQLNP
jgi:hypothetical protein